MPPELSVPPCLPWCKSSVRFPAQPRDAPWGVRGNPVPPNRPSPSGLLQYSEAAAGRLPKLKREI